MFIEITIQTSAYNEVMIHVNENGIVTRIYGYVSDWNINEAFTHIVDKDGKNVFRVSKSKNPCFFNFHCTFRSFCKKSEMIFIRDEEYSESKMCKHYDEIENLYKL